ncbi:hypothetical protein F4553_003199 [Allocatelliglobosispora scoriae]|uniref:Uncharacterized protein n=1 Tax=Allocatelliglobosispora scoriae TaxID=643052 RepID=A0A841BSQ3_9ACTN|nr:hypothetical protein [Allocatelliglobosispora scoriae]
MFNPSGGYAGQRALTANTPSGGKLSSVGPVRVGNRFDFQDVVTSEASGQTR